MQDHHYYVTKKNQKKIFPQNLSKVETRNKRLEKVSGNIFREKFFADAKLPGNFFVKNKFCKKNLRKKHEFFLCNLSFIKKCQEKNCFDKILSKKKRQIKDWRKVSGNIFRGNNFAETTPRKELSLKTIFD